jgi:glycosyltransferase involved in cell wall biosynthesis
MKVAIGPVTREAYGGVNQHVKNLMKFMDHDFTVMTVPRYSLTHPLYRALYMFMQKQPWTRSALRDPYWIFTEKAIFSGMDIVHFHGSPIWLEFYFRERKRGFKGIHTSHNFYFRDDAVNEREWEITEASNRLAVKSYGNADAVIAVAKWLKKHLREEHGIESVYIPNGVDVNEFKTGNPAAFRERYGIKSDYILYLGRISKYKRPKLFSDVARIMPEHTFVMAGDGMSRENLRGYLGYEPSENVKPVGKLERKDVINALSGCEAFVNTSTNEAFGISVLEAWACKKPVVAADNRGTKDVVNDGVDGFLFQSEDVEDIKEKILKAIERPMMGQKGYESVVSQYTWRTVAEQTNKVYESLLQS